MPAHIADMPFDHLLAWATPEAAAGELTQEEAMERIRRRKTRG